MAIIRIEFDTAYETLAQVLARLTPASATTEQATGDTGTGDTAAHSETTNQVLVTGDDVLAFLRSDPRYELRSGDAIAKHFGANADEALDILDNLVAYGHVIVKRQRGTGVALYKAAASAPTSAGSTTEQPAQPANEVGIRTFLGSDSRYTQRTLAAIQKHFASTPAHKVEELVYEMADDGDIKVKTRRSDGAELYELA